MMVSLMWRMAADARDGRLADYKRDRTRLLQRVNQTQHLQLAERVAKIALFVPAAGDELKVAAALGDQAFKTMPAEFKDAGWMRIAQGLAFLRTGKFSEAIEVLQPNLSETDPARWIESATIRTLAEFRLGHRDAAAALARNLDGMGEAALAYLDEPIYGDAAICRVLLNEVRECIGR